MHKIYLIFLLIFNYTFSQNLIPNFSFEEYTICPYSESFWPVKDWYRVINHSGTADNLNSCATDFRYTVPENGKGFQFPDDGNGYSGFFCYFPKNVLREYLQVKLTNPLLAGNTYEASFKISLADNSTHAINKIGIAITQNPIEGMGNLDYIPLTPQVFSDEIIYDKENWTEISGSFQAKGGESYLTVGNFFSDQEITIDELQSGQPFCYYFIDSFSLIDKTLSINGSKLAKVRLFPNPVKEEINIKIPSNYECNQIEIFSLYGMSRKYQGNLAKINLSELSSGIYFISIEALNGLSEIFTIIKE